MNDRIKELADKAQEYAEWMTPQGLEWLDNFKEQFAKLIIEECMEWCDAHATIDGSAQQIRNSIKNYFGVE